MRRRMTAAAAGILAALLMPTAAGAVELVFFRTPSANISCVAYPTDDGRHFDGVECEIDVITRNTLPAKRPADCELDWGNRVAIGRRGRPVLTCYGDTLAVPDAPPLAYGRSVDFGDILCSSGDKGLECANRSGHGFFLSKSRQRLF